VPALIRSLCPLQRWDSSKRKKTPTLIRQNSTTHFISEFVFFSFFRAHFRLSSSSTPSHTNLKSFSSGGVFFDPTQRRSSFFFTHIRIRFILFSDTRNIFKCTLSSRRRGRRKKHFSQQP
jgi:hypothetical protein